MMMVSTSPAGGGADETGRWVGVVRVRVGVSGVRTLGQHAVVGRPEEGGRRDGGEGRVEGRQWRGAKFGRCGRRPQLSGWAEEVTPGAAAAAALSSSAAAPTAVYAVAPVKPVVGGQQRVGHFNQATGRSSSRSS